MNANELAQAMEIRASIRRQATSRKSVQENANDRLADQLDEAATMLRQQQAEIEELKAAVRSFFNDYLDQREESDSGRVFAPIYISNCRCMTLDPMSKLMSKMRELSGAKPPPKGDW